MKKVFIIGSAGTTGLRLQQRLSCRKDIELLTISEKLRKNNDEIKRIVGLSDYAFLCLPDTAARELSDVCADCSAKLIDTSTAHRTNSSWAYGFPELSAEHRQKIKSANRVASPGCHAGGFISIVYPLVKHGIISPDLPLSCTSLTGYSGGGKKMIANYEADERSTELQSSMVYALTQQHKHLPEITVQCGLSVEPIFLPIVGDFYSGMIATVGLHKSQLNCKYTADDIRNVFKAHYRDSKIITVSDDIPKSLYTNSLSGKDSMEIFISGNDDRIIISSKFDNLGKGASGTAIQCFNIMCGLPEETGLSI